MKFDCDTYLDLLQTVFDKEINDTSDKKMKDNDDR